MTETNPSKPIGQAWKYAVAGSGAIIVAAGLDLAPSSSEALSAIRVLLTFGGALAIGIALYLRPGHVRLYILACAMAIVTRFGFPAEWDSGRILSGLGAIVAGLGALITALPTGYKKVAVSAIMLLHFGGILSAVTAPPSQPWLSYAAGVVFYRPYLQSVYLTNAYHFYSPEPGPASQLWFCIKYKQEIDPETKMPKLDPQTGKPLARKLRWFKFPRRPEDMNDPMALSYYRRLCLTQNLENREPAIVTDEMKRRRLVAAQGEPGKASGDQTGTGILFHPEFLPLESQYRRPHSGIRDFVLPSYVRHVAQMPKVQHDDHVTRIDTIRVYLVEHSILTPLSLENGQDPYDPTLYKPYFFGEFNTDGELLYPGDPLLYWLIPIFYEHNPAKGEIPPWHTAKSHPEDFIIIDCVKRHNGGVDHNLTN